MATATGPAATSTSCAKKDAVGSARVVDPDDITTSSILEFLNKERECFNSGEDASEIDVESLFEEINRLTEPTDRSIDELLREAEMLLSKEPFLIRSTVHDGRRNKDNREFGKPKQKGASAGVSAGASEARVVGNGSGDTSQPAPMPKEQRPETFEKIVEAVCPDSIISEESAPKDMKSDNDDSPTLDLTDSVGVISLQIDESPSMPTLDASTKIYSPIPRQHRTNKNDSEPISIASTPIMTESLSDSESLSKNDQTHCVPYEKRFCDKSTNPSPKHSVTTTSTSPIDNFSISREYALKNEIDVLQEKLKDTEERLQSLRIQHESLSHLHRDLRDSHARLQEESDLLKLDVQHLTECANILRSELQAARNDRKEALDVQKLLQSELEDSRIDKKKAQDQCEKDAKTILDLQRQCREMERILMRKHPDSVSALIVASKNQGKGGDESSASRRLLEQRIAQLEADAKEQDHKAQRILANVQARFNSVQSKYETHIGDLETQVLSLQEINTKLNEKIESHIKFLNNPCKDDSGYANICTQTEDLPEREANTVRAEKRNIFTQTDTSRPNSSTPSKIPSKKLQVNKMCVSHSDSVISTHHHATAKEDAHLLATIRGMRIDLALKDKAMQRLTRELEECKKTIKKLQKEKDSMKFDKPSSASSSSSTSRKIYDPSQFAEHAGDVQALKEAQSKIKLLENDYKALHHKRLQDLKTLQAAHEREMASCQESVRVLQQRLTERDEAFATQKRRKVPIDYYALKAKVSSLERRHSEREQRLHMLVEALSKGRLNGALEEILTEHEQ